MKEEKHDGGRLGFCVFTAMGFLEDELASCSFSSSGFSGGSLDFYGMAWVWLVNLCLRIWILECC